MNLEDFLNYCKCPCCGAELKSAEEREEVLCAEGHIFPLAEKRIPILMIDQENKEHGGDKFSNVETSKSFGKQWDVYKPGDKLWGIEIAKIKEFFLKFTGFEEKDIRGKTVLDLGCGHGIYCRVISEMGAQVVGCDITRGFLLQEPMLSEAEKDRINFVQGDIYNFPLKDDSFDIVWCSGVLHHTPDTKVAFDKIKYVVKKGGRLFLHLYKKGDPFEKTRHFLRFFTTKMPEWLLVPLCYLMALPYALFKWFLNITGWGFRKFEKRTLRENAVSLHDTFSPPYAWGHTEEEITQWLESSGFENITYIPDSPAGHYVYADRKQN